MPQSSAAPGKRPPEPRLFEVEGVPVYGRCNTQGLPSKIDAIDPDEPKIRAIADHLQRRGYGVMRRRNARAGKVLYTLNATWAGDGPPPQDPFDVPEMDHTASTHRCESSS